MGQSLGFLDKGIDVNNMIHLLDARLDLIAPVKLLTTYECECISMTNSDYLLAITDAVD
jgi:hypothetical protein